MPISEEQSSLQHYKLLLYYIMTKHGSDHTCVKNDVLRWTLVICGWLATLAGVVGLFLPLVPTVPFLLLAIACFVRSSPRCHSWLVEHRHLGPLVRDYTQGEGIPLWTKRMAICMVWVSLPTSTLLFADAFWLKILLMVTAVAITIFLLLLPTATKKT